MSNFLCLLFLATAHSRLLYTVLLSRHGAKYPSSDLYDGNETKSFNGALTPIGSRQLYLLGRSLRKLYIE